MLKEEESEESLKVEKKNPYALTVDELHIPKGEFVSVIGKVGSGKSTLLSAILGEIDKISGTVNRRGRVSYIPQVSWLKSATIRENILF